MNKNYLILTIVFSIFYNGCEKDKPNNTSQKNSTYELSGTYEVNGITSRLDWLGKKIAYGHNGTLMLKKGRIEAGSDGNISGDFEIDMQTINVTDLEGGRKNSLEGHLKADDFFGVDKFPMAYIKFNFNKSKIINDAVEIDADLTIKNITHPVSFKATIVEHKPKLKIEAEIVFDRSKYDVRFGSGKFFQNLGDKLILDEVNVDAYLNFN